MQYEVTQIISYLVNAETREEALEIWNADPRTGVVEFQSDTIELYNEQIEVN